MTGNGYETESGWWAENGIQIGYGTTGQIIWDTVLNCRVNNPDWLSTGILIVGSDGVQSCLMRASDENRHPTPCSSRVRQDFE